MGQRDRLSFPLRSPWRIRRDDAPRPWSPEELRSLRFAIGVFHEAGEHDAATNMEARLGFVAEGEEREAMVSLLIAMEGLREKLAPLLTTVADTCQTTSEREAALLEIWQKANAAAAEPDAGGLEAPTIRCLLREQFGASILDYLARWPTTAGFLDSYLDDDRKATRQ